MLSYLGDQVNFGSYTVTATYAGNLNRTGSSDSATITIPQASSTTTTLGADPFTYDGATHSGGTGMVTGARGLSTRATSLTFTGDQVNLGSYFVTAHCAGDANHNASEGVAVAIDLNEASSITTATGGSFLYHCTSHTGGAGAVPKYSLAGWLQSTDPAGQIQGGYSMQKLASQTSSRLSPAFQRRDVRMTNARCLRHQPMRERSKANAILPPLLRPVECCVRDRDQVSGVKTWPLG